MNRRSFLVSILASGLAPAAVGSSILMPIRKLVKPPPYMEHFFDYEGRADNIKAGAGKVLTTQWVAGEQVSVVKWVRGGVRTE